MKNKKIFLYLILFTSLLFDCSDYLDVDTDTDRPTTATLPQLLSQIGVQTGRINDFRLWSGDILQVYTHQLTAREDQDQYGANADDVLMNNDWGDVYLTQTNINSLIDQAEINNDRMYLGIAQLMQAYISSVAVDLWGDVPYSEAIQLPEIVGPVFDAQESVYAAVLDLIETGKQNVASGEGIEPGADDLFYAGNTSKWIKFANSFKLKLYNQIRLSSLYDQTAVNSLISENNFFSSNSDDFEFNHTANLAPADERNQLFRDAYGGAQVTKYVSPWFYEILKGWNTNIHTGIEDPRIPYYWANQLAPGVFPRDQGDVTTMDPNADYWDASTGFFSIRFGSIGPDRDHAVQTDATFPGIFPCGGRYDDGAGFARTIASGTGVAPKRIFTYDEFLYVQAEMIQVGLITGNAETMLTNAITASFDKVDQVVSNSGTTQIVPTLTGSSSVTDFITDITTEFNSANSDKQLEIIMTQKWVATFGDPMDQYSDIRRTGYPILADPKGASPEYQLDNGDGFPLDDSHTVLTSEYQISLFWPQRELNLNKNAPAQKNPTTYKIFWDN
ncbi:MAG: Uncharacterised protein [Formosa sp. Hel1_33_131]|nr:MAG: Uncharacterised protein [Formosa sp. Hel1_33_131]